MSFTKPSRRRFEAGKTRFVLPPIHTSPVVRYAAYALVALTAALYFLVRHFTVTPPPMHRHLAAPPAATFDADSGEIPAPELVGPDGG
ncbi:MAG TPA: hypothetical protein VGG39_31400 [Polyangiaceae bacterium]